MAEIAVLIPTVHRADRIENLLGNVYASTATDHVVYFVAENSDAATK